MKEKIKKSISKHYPKINLYLDDMKEITEVIETQGKGWVIETDTYRYDDFEELAKSKQDLKKIRITTKEFPCERYTHLTINEYSAYLEITNDDIIANGMFSKIDQILRRRKRNILLINFGFWVMAVVFSTMAQKIVSVFIADDLLYGTLAGILVIVLLVKVIPNTKNQIFLVESHQNTNFFQRKKDDLLVALISGFIGAILGVLGTIATQNISAPKTESPKQETAPKK